MKRYIKAYMNTILDITEDKPPFLIPKMVYYIIIAVYFHQLSGYLFSTEEKKALNEEKIKFIARINELSSGTYLLYYKA